MVDGKWKMKNGKRKQALLFFGGKNFPFNRDPILVSPVN